VRTGQTGRRRDSVFVKEEASGPKCRRLNLILLGYERSEDPREAFGWIRVVDLPPTRSAADV
jgi:hypothetical protein